LHRFILLVIQGEEGGEQINATSSFVEDGGHGATDAGDIYSASAESCDSFDSDLFTDDEPDVQQTDV
jgi:hypothetical protein